MRIGAGQRAAGGQRPAASSAADRRGLFLGVLGAGLLLMLFDASVIQLTGDSGGWAYWWPMAVPTAVVLWLTRRDWPRAPRHFIVLVAAVDALSATVTGFSLVTGGAPVWVFTESAALMSLLFATVRWLPLRFAAWLGVATGIVASALPIRFSQDAGSWGSLAMCLIWSLGSVAAAVLGTYLRHQENRRRQALVEVRRDTRLDLARDLHDFVAHHVSGIVVQAQASQLIAAEHPDQAVAALRRIEEAGQQALASMRRTVQMLRDDHELAAPNTPSAGVGDLTDLVERFNATGGATVHMDVEHGAADALPPEVTTSTHRVVLEALTNVRKHAVGATRVDLTIRRDDTGPTPKLIVQVRDNAPPNPHTSERPGGFGLVGLHERVTAIGGSFDANAVRDGGWQVTADLPLSATSQSMKPSPP